MNHGATSAPLAPDLGAIFEFQDSRAGTSLGVSLATLLQCLCIAEQRNLVPPFEADWAVETIPPALLEMAQLNTDDADANSHQG
ncbi:hypothetical protein PCPL58_p3084 (plasmid) [Pseudomonas cerasi]|uniref:Uncharacterized protein n=1 Tax=Pseudomonas cerasi TaxID=1583341 RepID=A0A193SGW0_9PSED|nr:hypothetical protein PCPL58_p3010 [Pseudomonas cerasi]CZT26178.1 hypothetical protein PCPL58_p3084 [Pseudomonas cerasi]SOS30253.1 hypothetical protein PL963_P200130 [Pseudomonas cerasi]